MAFTSDKSAECGSIRKKLWYLSQWTNLSHICPNEQFVVYNKHWKGYDYCDICTWCMIMKGGVLCLFVLDIWEGLDNAGIVLTSAAYLLRKMRGWSVFCKYWVGNPIKHQHTRNVRSRGSQVDEMKKASPTAVFFTNNASSETSWPLLQQAGFLRAPPP